MAGTTDVKSLLLEVDASVELLRRNLTRGDQAVGQFESETRARLDRMDRRFEQLGGGLRQLPGTIGRARAEIATLGNSVARVEGQVRASSSAMRSALLSSTAAIGAALSANQVKEYADGYTRFTNQLKVAGLEGAALAKTQNDLFAVAQKGGVQLELLGRLYGGLASLQKDLGTSSADSLGLTQAVSNSIKVQGTSAESAAGAILGLNQALAQTRVQSDEYNQILDGARPLLQAAADASDKYGGSLAKLKQDIEAGKVSGKDLFAFLQGGFDILAERAGKANLTIAQSFTVLNNALGKYIGETDASLSATARIAGAIAGLANNLDTIVPVLTTIAVAYGSVKVAGLALSGISTVVATVIESDRAFARQVLLGNASLVSRAQLAARSAELAAAGAATEVASIESTIAARQAERAALIEQIAAERALVTERQAAAQAAAVSLTQGGLNGRNAALAAQARANNDATFATQRLTAARQRLAAVDGELAVAEGSLAGAQARSALATDVATAASARATLAARAGAAASRLFAGALTLIGGSVAGGAAVLAIGALVVAVLHFRAEMQAAEERNRATAAALRDTAEAGRDLNQKMAELAIQSSGAASGIARVGANAVTSTAKVLSFAGAVGEAAEKLRQLAEARRHEQVLGFTTISVAAEHRANEAQARIDDRARARQTATAKGEVLPISDADRRANADDARIVAANRAAQGAAYRSAQQAAQLPLASRIRESDRVGGRDIDGDLARVTRDLVVARQRGIRSQVESLEAQKFELTQYKKYRADGLSPQAAQEAASADAGSFRGASAGAQGDRDAKTGRAAKLKGERAAAAADRKQDAVVRDAAADERAYSAAQRQANNDIAAARADLTNSAVERAQIEKDRIESERINRKNEIEQQAKQGGLGVGDAAKTRKLELQRLNDERAKLETDVVDAREKQRVADEALAIAQSDRDNQVELLQKQADLVTSAGQRRDLERRILEIQYASERAQLEGVIASRDTTEAEKEIARRKLAILGQLQAADQKGNDDKNAGPLDQYRKRLGDATSNIGEALDTVAVNSLQNFEDGLLGIVTGTESVGSAFKKMANAIIADLARIAIQKAILAALDAVLPGSGSILRIFGGKADGGKIEGRAGGGRISGPGTGTSDSVLALIDGIRPLLVSNGEYVMTAAATRRFEPLLAAMNKGGVPGLAAGGKIGGASIGSLKPVGAPSLDGFGGGRRDRTHVTAEVSVNPSPLFDTRVQQVTIQTVGAAAEPIMAGAEARTIARLQRPTLPGGFG